MSDDVDSAEVWNATLAAALPGKTLLVGLTYLNSDGALLKQQQFFGRVSSAHPRQGIVLDLQGTRAGEQFTLAPDTRPIQAAASGQYRLRSTGEVVMDPDFTATFTIHKTKHGDGAAVAGG